MEEFRWEVVAAVALSLLGAGILASCILALLCWRRKCTCTAQEASLTRKVLHDRAISDLESRNTSNAMDMGAMQRMIKAAAMVVQTATFSTGLRSATASKQEQQEPPCVRQKSSTVEVGVQTLAFEQPLPTTSLLHRQASAEGMARARSTEALDMTYRSLSREPSRTDMAYRSSSANFRHSQSTRPSFQGPSNILPYPVGRQTSMTGSSPAHSTKLVKVREMAEELAAGADHDADVTASERLTLLQPIAKGGFGQVYKGVWRGLEVAVKTVLFSDDANTNQQNTEARALMEAAVCASVTHPNVVCTYHYDIAPVTSIHDSRLSLVVEDYTTGGQQTHDFKLYLIQELCHVTFRSVLYDCLLHNQQDGKPDMDPVLTILADVARGLAYLHTKNIIHGDLKPENVLMKVDPSSPIGVVAKITDFGLSRAIAPNTSHLSNVIGGTPFYQAPETVRDGQLTKSSDVYSFGALMWEVYLRCPPWVKKPQGGLQYHHHFGLFPPSTPPRFKWLCRRCLDPGPRNRPAFKEILSELGGMLDAFLDGHDDLIKPHTRHPCHNMDKLPASGTNTLPPGSGQLLRYQTSPSPISDVGRVGVRGVVGGNALPDQVMTTLWGTGNTMSEGLPVAFGMPAGERGHVPNQAMGRPAAGFLLEQPPQSGVPEIIAHQDAKSRSLTDLCQLANRVQQAQGSASQSHLSHQGEKTPELGQVSQAVQGAAMVTLFQPLSKVMVDGGETTAAKPGTGLSKPDSATIDIPDNTPVHQGASSTVASGPTDIKEDVIPPPVAHTPLVAGLRQSQTMSLCRGSINPAHDADNSTRLPRLLRASLVDSINLAAQLDSCNVLSAANSLDVFPFNVEVDLHVGLTGVDSKSLIEVTCGDAIISGLQQTQPGNTEPKEVGKQQEISHVSDEDCVLLGPQEKFTTGSTSWVDSEQETASRAASQVSRFLP